MFMMNDIMGSDKPETEVTVLCESKLIYIHNYRKSHIIHLSESTMSCYHPIVIICMHVPYTHQW